MDRPATELVRSAPKRKPGGEDELIDQAGQALLAQIKEAANVSKESIERAMTMAHRLSLELRAAQERISQLEAAIEHLESRATRAEQWLGVIKNEIEVKLIAPMEANRPELPALH
jgi:predicted  nucleic acid-binding Zn-ribbon protein